LRIQLVEPFVERFFEASAVMILSPAVRIGSDVGSLKQNVLAMMGAGGR
jgi:hypothetical protein